jgi:hypothetical protein
MLTKGKNSMSAEKRSSLLADLTAIPDKPKVKKSPAKAQQATAKLNRLAQTKKTKSRKEMYEEVKAQESEIIKQQQEAVRAEIITPSIGRPSEYTPERAAVFCVYISAGMSLRTACKQDGMPDPKTIFKWMGEHEDFVQHYTRATAERAEAFQEDILDIADNGSNDWMEAHYGNSEVWITNGEALQRSRLRVETRKWLMEKMKPKKYGNKVDLTSDGKALPIALLGGASANPDIINDKETPNQSGQVPENAG